MYYLVKYILHFFFTRPICLLSAFIQQIVINPDEDNIRQYKGNEMRQSVSKACQQIFYSANTAIPSWKFLCQLDLSIPSAFLEMVMRNIRFIRYRTEEFRKKSQSLESLISSDGETYLRVSGQTELFGLMKKYVRKTYENTMKTFFFF